MSLPLAAGTIVPTAPGGRPVVWAATGRWGGVSAAPFDSLNLADYVGDEPRAVRENRSRLVDALGMPGGQPAVAGAVHGGQVAVVDGPGTVPGVDALVTRTPGVVILAMGADCVPIGIVGADGGTVAVAHCGWRGLVADVLGAAVASVRASGTDVSLVVLGPAVCGSCYPVPTERADQVRRGTSEAVGRAALATTPDGQPGVDVRRGLRARLAELGIVSVSEVGGCTVEDPGLFSYRRDRITGRQGIALGLLP